MDAQYGRPAKRPKRFWPNPHEDALSLFGSLFDEAAAWARVRDEIMPRITEALERWRMPLADGRFSDDLTWYTGLGGLAVLYLRAAVHRNSKDYARRALGVAERCLAADPSRYVSHMCGPCGHAAVVACAKLFLGEPTSLAPLLAEADLASTHDENEFLLGKAGYLAALLWTRRFFMERGADTRALTEPARRVAKALVAAGLAADKFRLDFACFGQRYAGAAHGLAGCLAALHWCGALGWLDSEDSQRVRASSLAFSRHCLETHHVPVTLPGEGENDELVHWCHGAAGVPEYARAAVAHARRDDDTALVEAACSFADMAVEVVWRRGLVLKGSGLCHGIAGNAYAFVSAARFRREPASLLARARAFAALLDNPRLRAAQAAQPDPQRLRRGTPDSPLSLMEGDAGLACFLMDLAHGGGDDPGGMLGFPGYADIGPDDVV